MPGMRRRLVKCRSTRATATTPWASHASCNVDGTRRSASKISIVTRSKPSSSAERSSSRSSEMSRTRSAGSSRTSGSSSAGTKMNVFALRAAELTEARPELAAAVGPLLKAREAIERQIADLDRKVLRLARNDAQVQRFMTAPGVGAITALCFLATIDDPTRFKRSRSVGAYVGLTTRRYASGEVDWTGRISKCGDKLLRSYLYEAANVLLTRVAKWSALKAWGIRLAKRSGLRKAKVAV